MTRLRLYPIFAAVALLVPGCFSEVITAHVAVSVDVGKSLIIDSESDIERVSVSAALLAEAIGINSREILVNGLQPGETSVVIWETGGKRLVYDLTVLQNLKKVDAVRRQLAVEVGPGVNLDFDNDTVFLRGTAPTVAGAQRAVTISATLGKVVDLLNVVVPPPPAQILLKVRFVNVERSASSQLGFSLLSTSGQLAGTSTKAGEFTLGDALNLLLTRKDFNLSATLTALQTKNLVEILSEPNVLAIDGQTASFLAGGEFPYPTVQGGAVAGAVSIAFREFGIKIKFLPIITPRGTIRLHVTPEVSSLDFANGLVYQGFNVPALVSRRVDTEVELESGQSFAIAGLLDQRVTETLSKVPGIGDIPILGKLFQSKTRTPTNSELLVIITPELVRPIPSTERLPDLIRPKPFLKDAPTELPRTPGMDVTGPVPVTPLNKTVPVELLIKVTGASSVAAPSSAAPASTTPVVPPTPIPDHGGTEAPIK